MVSWFRFLDTRWSDFEHQLRPNGHSVAIRAHEGFSAVKNLPSDEIEAGFKDWLKDSKDCPGVLMVVRGRSNSNKGMIDTIHQLKLVKDKRDVTLVMGVAGLSAVTTMVGVPLDADLFGDLSLARKTRSAAMKDRYIPTIEGLMDGRHPIADKFTPRILDECEQVDSMRQWPNSIFVPFPIVDMIWSIDSDEEDAEPLSLEAGSILPRALLLRLIAGVKLK